MAQPLYNLLFLGCFWLAGSLVLQLVRDSYGDILTALLGRGGFKRLPRAAA